MWHRVSLFLLILITLRGTCGSILASGKLQSCVNNGNATELQCSEKIVLALTIENNKLHATDSIVFDLACIDSPTGTCPCPCNHQNEPGCACRDLRHKLTVSITKTPIYALYSLSQPRTFNGRPYEEYITTGPGGTGGSTCDDDWNSASPTCGFARGLDEEGNMQDILDSQGFCCNCPSWGSSTPIARGYRSCPFSGPWGQRGSAHCLRYDDWWWYRGYLIGPYQLDFDIHIEIKRASMESNATASQPGGEQMSELLSLNPSRSIMRSNNGTVLARLLGDLSSYRQIQELDGHWLMIPLQPGLSPNEILSSNLDMWMVIPPEKVSLSGTECDKVGVGYSAFRYQSNRCDQPIGSCLRNQIFDFEYEDERRIEEGLPPLYNIKRYGGGSANTRQLNGMESTGDLSLRLPLSGLQTSIISLEVVADDIQVVTNRASARIVDSKLCDFGLRHCGRFQGIVGTGYMHVQVQNIGDVAAEFWASILGCSNDILPVLEQYATIEAGMVHNFTFELKANSDQGGNQSCTAIVTDAIGDLADYSQIEFYLEAVEYEKPPDQSDLGGKPVDPNDPPEYRNCERLCPNIFHVVCLVKSLCWRRLCYSVLSIIGLCTALTLLLILAWKLLLPSVFKLLKGGKSSEDQVPSNQRHIGEILKYFKNEIPPCYFSESSGNASSREKQ